MDPAAGAEGVDRVFGSFAMLDEVAVVPKFQPLISFMVEFLGESGIFSGLGGQIQVNSLVLEFSRLRLVNLGLYPTTYVRRSNVTESS